MLLAFEILVCKSKMADFLCNRPFSLALDGIECNRAVCGALELYTLKKVLFIKVLIHCSNTFCEIL